MANKYSRILLKLSGEAFLGEREHGIDPKFTQAIAKEIKQVHEAGVQVAIVVGGGNIFRGTKAAENGLDRVTGDYIGMLASVMNSMALQSTFDQLQVETRIQSAIDIPKLAEPLVRRRAIQHLEEGRIVLFAAGTGHPFVTHDMAGALRALETNCDVLFKATKVDGVYSADPITDPTATRYEHLTFQEAMDNQHIEVMDRSAITLCAENNLPIIVFQLTKPGNLVKAAMGEPIGTIINKT